MHVQRVPNTTHDNLVCARPTPIFPHRDTMHLNLPLVQAKLTVVDGKPPSSVLCHRDGGKPVLVVAPATSYPALPALPPEPAAAEAPLKEIVEGMASSLANHSDSNL